MNKNGGVGLITCANAAVMVQKVYSPLLLISRELCLLEIHLLTAKTVIVIFFTRITLHLLRFICAVAPDKRTFSLLREFQHLYCRDE